MFNYKWCLVFTQQFFFLHHAADGVLHINSKCLPHPRYNITTFMFLLFSTHRLFQYKIKFPPTYRFNHPTPLQHHVLLDPYYPFWMTMRLQWQCQLFTPPSSRTTV